VDKQTIASSEFKKNCALVVAALILILGSVYAVQHGAFGDMSGTMYHQLRQVASNSQTF
jgi:hypothetical protein